MKTDSINISYPSIHIGTEKSEITFLPGVPDLSRLFFEDNKDEVQRRFFITDANVASLECMRDFTSKFDDGVYGKDILIVLGSGEKYKTIETVLNILTEAVEAGFTRKDIFVGIGGGVICDITAFAASIFKRGAQAQFIPTTLLAMVDASIGGKTGCDYNNYKNIIGTFYPAKKIYYFPEFVQYLPENQYNSGLAEAFKTALLFDKNLFEIFRNESDKINARDKDLLMEIIRTCVKAKGNIVEQDFTEQGIRAYLNLGHSFGHALETLTGLGNVTHGYAVAWGISRSVELAYRKEYCMQNFKDTIFEILKKYGWETAPIPAVIKGGGVGERLISVMHKDKKNLTDKIRIVLQKNITETSVEEVEDSEILSVLK